MTIIQWVIMLPYCYNKYIFQEDIKMKDLGNLGDLVYSMIDGNSEDAQVSFHSYVVDKMSDIVYGETPAKNEVENSDEDSY